MALLSVSSWRTGMAREEVHRTAFLMAVFHTTFWCYKKLTGWDSSRWDWVRDQRVWLSELPGFNKIGVLCWNYLQVEGCVPHSTISFMTWPICLTRSGGNRNQASADTKIWDRWVWWNTTSPCWSLKACKCYGAVSDIEVADRVTGTWSTLLPNNLSV